jgi:hypothetical protein
MSELSEQEYQPKGLLCLNCARVKFDCASLPFHAMPVIGEWQGVKIVRCIEHVPVQRPEEPAQG